MTKRPHGYGGKRLTLFRIPKISANVNIAGDGGGKLAANLRQQNDERAPPLPAGEEEHSR